MGRPPRPSDSVNTSGGSSRRPPPPPDSGSDVTIQGNIDGAIASDGNIAFDAPDFDFHDNFCEPSPISDNYQQWYGSKLEGMWTYPEYKYCENVPVCLACPALGRCGPTGDTSGETGSCTCNGYVNSRGQGEC